MNVDTSHRDGAVILHLGGTMHHGGGDDQFREVFEELMERGEQRIVLSLEGVTSMDSSGLGELVRAKTTAARYGAELRLANVRPRVLQLLEIAQLVEALGVRGSVDDAIADLPS